MQRIIVKSQLLTGKSIQKQKFIPNEEQSKVIMNYFMFSNFQDFNSWQQVAKTKTEYLYQQVDQESYKCIVNLVSQNPRITIQESGEGKSKKESKRTALQKIIKILMNKGMIGFGFKQTDFISKLPRRRLVYQYEEIILIPEMHNQNREQINNLLMKDQLEQALTLMTVYNIDEIWTYALANKNIGILKKVLSQFLISEVQKKELEKLELSEQIRLRLKHSSPLKQFVYSGQFKDPTNVDLTGFIKFHQYQLQLPKYSAEQFSEFKKQKPIQKTIILPVKEFQNSKNQNSLIHNINNFKTVQNICEMHLKRQKVLKNNYKKQCWPQFYSVTQLKYPIFEETQINKQLFELDMLQNIFNQVMCLSDNYELCIQTLQILQKVIQPNLVLLQNDYDTLNASEKKRLIQYWIQKKKQLVCQMTFNIHKKIQNLSNSLSIQGMITDVGIRNKFDYTINFICKQPEQYLERKFQKKRNTNEFQQVNQFCLQQIVLVINKNNGFRCIGFLKEINLPLLKINVPQLKFLLKPDQLPLSVTVVKILNGKIFNRMSLAIRRAVKSYDSSILIQKMDEQNQIIPIVVGPSSPKFQLICQLLSQWISKKLLVLIVSFNFVAIQQTLSAKGFKSIAISDTSEDKQVVKYNIICVSPLNVICDLLKSYQFDRILIQDAQKIPQIISLLSITVGCKKIYMIGDPNLTRSEMQSPVSKIYNMQQSLFQRILQQGCLHFTCSGNKQDLSLSFDFSLSQWLSNSIYANNQLFIDETKFSRSPLIKGFNWPSPDHRVCLIDYKTQHINQNQMVNGMCFLACAIAVQILNSKFTIIEQISFCCLDNKVLLVLQSYVFNMIRSLQYQPANVQKILGKLFFSLDGSEFRKNDLLIIIGHIGNFSHINKSQTESNQMQRKLVSSLIQAQRGSIIIGSVDQLHKVGKSWQNFINWLSFKKLILKYQINQEQSITKGYLQNENISYGEQNRRI